MADNGNMNKKGFSGLSDLTSEIQGLDNEPIKLEQKEDIPPPEPKQQPQWHREIGSSEPERQNTSYPMPIKTVSPGKSDEGANIAMWLLIGAGVIFLIIIAANSQQGNKSYYPSPTPPSQNSYLQSRPAPASSSPGVTQSPTQGVNLQYTKPSVGTNNVLSSSEIRWCLREEIRLEAMRSFIEMDARRYEFDSLINDYNSRCGSYRYRQGTLEQAKREVESYRSQIVADAMSEAKQVGQPYQSSVAPASSPPLPSNIPEKSTASSVAEKEKPQPVREAQQLLAHLGYKPGPIDNDYGRRTADAVKAFQRDTGITQDGQIDEFLLGRLRKAKNEQKSHTVSHPQNQASTQPRSNSSQISTSTSAGYFTLGTHQDEVRRIQGAPSSVDDYSVFAVWRYGSSDVKMVNRRVVEWHNRGNLKVRLNPGANVTNNSYFTIGSHQDDVARIQGTPSSVDDYSVFTVWHYGSSDVKMVNRRVAEWHNRGNLKVRLNPGANVTSNLYFVIGSHQDDVIRIQGTPSSIDDYSVFSIWHYENSDVKIVNKRVSEFNNRGNLKTR